MTDSLATSFEPPVAQDIPCPLCGYNLRGLPEARCPECGARYEWDKLLDPAKKKHPYLFEHHPERNIRSFLRTLIAGMLPSRFWRTLHPAQAYRPRRLIAYWMICALTCLAVPATQYALDFYSIRLSMIQARADLTNYYKSPQAGQATMPTSGRAAFSTVAFKEQLDYARQQSGTVDRYIDTQAPQPTFKLLFQRVPSPIPEVARSGGLARGNFAIAFNIFLAFALLAWPWIAALLLMLLRTTMRQASVRPIHLLRVTIYSADIVVWFAIPTLALVALNYYQYQLRTVPSILPWTVATAASWIAYAPALAMLIITWRFAIAIGRYLRFRHALGVAIAVQVIVLLLTMKVLVICT